MRRRPCWTRGRSRATVWRHSVVIGKGSTASGATTSGASASVGLTLMPLKLRLWTIIEELRYGKEDQDYASDPSGRDATRGLFEATRAERQSPRHGAASAG